MISLYSPRTDVRKRFVADAVAADFFDMWCGKLLGHGISRVVYENRGMAGTVIKIEVGDYFQNIYEWQVWKHVKETEHAKWFAPCIAISPSGKVLVQRQTKPLKEMLKEVPAFFTDCKLDNWGLYKGRPVCHDYGLHRFLEVGMTNRMRKL